MDLLCRIGRTFQRNLPGIAGAASMGYGLHQLHLLHRAESRGIPLGYQTSLIHREVRRLLNSRACGLSPRAKTAVRTLRKSRQMDEKRWKAIRTLQYERPDGPLSIEAERLLEAVALPEIDLTIYPLLEAIVTGQSKGKSTGKGGPPNRFESVDDLVDEWDELSDKYKKFELRNLRRAIDPARNYPNQAQKNLVNALYPPGWDRLPTNLNQLIAAVATQLNGKIRLNQRTCELLQGVKSWEVPFREEKAKELLEAVRTERDVGDLPFLLRPQIAEPERMNERAIYLSIVGCLLLQAWVIRVEFP